eukprot:8925052-Pyramimonas_sp.AAC.1
MAAAFRRTRAGSDTASGIPGVLVKAHATAVAEFYYPLQLKCVLTLMEPVQWKGGFYRDLIKSGQADPTQCGSS